MEYMLAGVGRVACGCAVARTAICGSRIPPSRGLVFTGWKGSFAGAMAVNVETLLVGVCRVVVSCEGFLIEDDIGNSISVFKAEAIAHAIMTYRTAIGATVCCSRMEGMRT